MTPIFSIVTPSFNKESYIAEMIDSVLLQSEKRWELIIVDDASTDDTTEILKQFKEQDKRISIQLNKKNKGANYCRNVGLKKSTGRYVIFFDADDIMTKDCLTDRKSAIQSKPSADLWIFNMGLFNQELGDTSKKKDWIVPSEPSKYLSLFLKHQIPWSIMQSTWTAEFIKKINGFDLGFKKYQDIEIHTRAIIEGARIIAFPNSKTDVYYRIDEKRKNFHQLEFQKRSVSASIDYYNKFFSLLQSKQEKKLLSYTLLETLAGLCWQLKTKAISKSDYIVLKNNLLQCCKIRNHKIILKSYQKLNRIIPFHLPGLKKMITIIIGF